jgi:nitrogenase molybdenum-cofactor synthesis protein NifE
MLSDVDRLIERGCNRPERERLCRSRGGESCAFDGATIVLQCIADTAHLIHGPIACCGNSWQTRGTLSEKGSLYRMGFTTDLSELDIIHGSEDKLYNAILYTYETVKPSAIFVYATCVSGLIGENIEAVCKEAEKRIGSGRVIPVNAPGFVGPKNLGNRIAGEVLLEEVIGTGEPPYTTAHDINLIGEYNIAGDLWLVEPLLKEAGIRVLSKITGDSTFEEITYAHRARLNLVICSRALLNVAKEMEYKYGIPYIEVSFFGKTETTKALRLVDSMLNIGPKLSKIIETNERWLEQQLKEFSHLKGKRAVLYTGGVKSWSFISALLDLGMEVVAVGTKKSTYEDEEKMKALLGEDAPLYEDVSPQRLKALMKEKKADILIAGGRNLYLAMKEGFPFVDVNQERHRAYAGYKGLVTFAEDISRSIHFFSQEPKVVRVSQGKESRMTLEKSKNFQNPDVVINPLKLPASTGAVIAFQGIDRALPVIHGSQGCVFLAKALLTRHFREPIALQGSKLFTEDVILGGEERLRDTLLKLRRILSPEIVGVLSSGLTEVKGEDIKRIIGELKPLFKQTGTELLYISTPDFKNSLEKGYQTTVCRLIEELVVPDREKILGQINILVGGHLTPSDFSEVREMVEVFGLKPLLLPDLSSLDGSRQGFSSLAQGGTKVSEIREMGRSEFTIAIGASMQTPAELLKEITRVEYTLIDGLSGLRAVDRFMEVLSVLSGRTMPERFRRQRRSLIDGMRDAHFYLAGRRVSVALENDLALQVSQLLEEMGAKVTVAVVPYSAGSEERIKAEEVIVGGLFSIDRNAELIISNSRAQNLSRQLKVPLYQMGFPVYRAIGYTTKVTVGYRGSLTLINDLANLSMEVHQ